MANTTFNPSDKAANCALTVGNLVATCSSGVNGWCRAVDKQIAGKFYWEVTATTIAAATTGFGISAFNSDMSSAFASNTGTCGVDRGGTVYVDGANQGTALLGTIVGGTVVCFAFDADSRLIWIRSGAAGNWNGSAGANPATGAGGILTKLGRGIPAYPAWRGAASGEVATANFGDTAFVGAVPSGYTSGFTATPVTALLVHADGANGSTTFTDVSSNARPLTATSTTVSTTSPKFGTGSADFTAGSSSRIVEAGLASDFSFGVGQFTVEAWAYFTAAPSGTHIILAQWFSNSNLGFSFRVAASVLSFFYSTTGTDTPSVGAAFSPTLNTWYHLAADRDAASVLRVYVNGAVLASATVTASLFPSTLNVTIGNDGGFVRAFPGRLDELRITRGLARYGGAFTAPTAPFVADYPIIPTNAIASQALAEHWLTTNPAAQITQVVAEHWASVASGNLQAVVTQVMLEHWASVAVVVPAAGGPMVTMIH
jgi:hypothetical protein